MVRGTLKCISCWLAAGCLTLLTACGGGGAPPVATPHSTPDPATAPQSTIVGAAGQPSFPIENGPRSFSANGDALTVLGKDYLQLKHAAPAGETLLIGPDNASDNENISYGLYRLSGLSGKFLTSLTVSALPGELGMGYYVALADFTNLQWKWFGPVSLPEFKYDFTADANHYISPLGNVYFVVATHGANTATHQFSLLHFAGSPPGGGGGNPGAPTNLVASDGVYSDHIGLSWNAGDGAQWYEVFRARYAGNQNAPQWDKLGDAQTTAYADNDVAPGQNYYYKVRSAAADNSNTVVYSGFGNIDSGYLGQPQGGNPGAPKDLLASNGTFSDHIGLTWTAGADAQWYEVMRYAADQSNSGWEQLGTCQAPAYSDSAVSPGQVYYYKVRAARSGGNGAVRYSEYSNIDSGYAGQQNSGGPGQPASLTASDGVYADRVALAWTAGAGDQWFVVYRYLSEGNSPGWIKLGESQVASYADTQVAAGLPYYYKVKAAATDANGQTVYSDFSNTDSGFAGTRDDGSPGTPTNLTASDGDYPDHVAVSWYPAASAQWYELWRMQDGQNNGWTLLGTSEATSYSDLNLPPGQVYQYKVRTARSGDNGATVYSDFSNVDSGYAQGQNAP